MEVSGDLIEKTAETLYFEEHSSSGQCCNFIDLENGWGLKCYQEKENRDRSYVCQEFLSQYELAPKVGKSFELFDHNGDAWYCHVTEVVEPLVEYGFNNDQAYEEELAELDETSDFDEDEFRARYCRDERDEWINEVHRQFGVYYVDDHCGNFGFMQTENGKKLVAIDFDIFYRLYKKILSGELAN